MTECPASAFIGAHTDVAAWWLARAADDTLTALLSDLLRLFQAAVERLRTELGRVAITAALMEIVNDCDDWDQKNAAELLLTFAQFEDIPGVESALRTLGYHAFEQRLRVVEVTDRELGMLAAIATLFRRLLPEKNTAAGRALLEQMASEITTGTT